jgi:hypothetical protein
MTTAMLIGPTGLRQPDLHDAVVSELERVDPWARHPQLALYAAALSRGDGQAAATILIRRFSAAGSAYHLLSVYALTVLVQEQFAASGREFHGSEFLQRTIRQQIRCELVRLPPSEEILWLIPASSADRTAVHVAALILTCRGATARPWLWSGIPEQSYFRIIGASGGTLPAAGSSNCVGVSAFADLVLPAMHGAQPGATKIS